MIVGKKLVRVAWSSLGISRAHASNKRWFAQALLRAEARKIEATVTVSSWLRMALPRQIVEFPL
jgi:hypothetical protein